MKKAILSFLWFAINLFLTADLLHAYIVSGTVFDAVTNAPIPKAMITFYADSISPDVTLVPTVYTDEQGFYSAELDEGNYFIFVYHESYEHKEFYNVAVTTDTILNFGLYPSIIPDVYKNSLSGVVKDKNTNMPIAYASVTLSPRYTDPPIINYYSDESGKFNITNILPGIYSLTAWQNGYVPYFDTTEINIDDSTKIEGVEIALEPLKSFYNIKIRVFSIDENGNKVMIPYTEVYLYGDYSAYSGVTDESGECTFDSFVGGHYQSYIYANGYSQNLSRFEINSDNQIVEIELEKLFLGRITGRVYSNSDQKPVMGVNLHAFSKEVLRYDEWYNYTAVSDSNGKYTIELPEGQYVVMATYLNSYNFYFSIMEYYNDVQSIEEAEQVVVGNDSSTTDIDFGLDINFPEIIPVTVSGKITSSDGMLIDYADLVFNDVLNFRYEQIGLKIDPYGNYSADLLLFAGHNELTLGVYTRNYEQQFYNGKSSWYDADIISVEISDSSNIIPNINFTLLPYRDMTNYSISGRVTDDADNALPGAYIEAIGTNGVSSYALSDSLGEYFIGGLPEGEYILSFYADMYMPQFYDNVYEWENATVIKLSSDITGINASLKKQEEKEFAGIISGKVISEDNVPIAGAKIILSTPQNDAVAADVTNSKGEFQLKGINQADYLITVSQVNYNSYKSDLSYTTRESGVHYFKLSSAIPTGIKGPGSTPDRYYLAANYPNPFNPSTKIKFQIKLPGRISLKVYDVLGKEVATLINEERPAGEYEFDFNASGLASGVYFYKLQSNAFTQVKKMMVLK